MKNVMTIAGHQAAISYDPDTEMLRGEFTGLNGGADFYATDIAGLHREGELSLQIFLEECVRHGIEPRKHFSGRLVLRITPENHMAATLAAAAADISLNQWLSRAIHDALNRHCIQDRPQSRKGSPSLANPDTEPTPNNVQIAAADDDFLVDRPDVIEETHFFSEGT